MIVLGKYIIPDLTQDVVLENAGLYVEKDRIVEIGTISNLLVKHPNVRKVGGNDYLIIPGLIDSHQHGRGLAHTQRGVFDKRLELWIHELMGELPVPTYYNTALAAMKLLENGITCTLHCDSCIAPERYEEEVVTAIKAYKDVGIRVAFALDIRDQNSFVYEDDSKFLLSLPKVLRKDVSMMFGKKFPPIEDFLKLFDRVKNDYEDDCMKILIAPQGVQWCSDNIFIATKEKSNYTGCGVHMHLLETRYQKEYFITKFGKTAVEYLNRLDFFNKKISCAHSVWLTDNDIEILAASSVIVVHNPSSNLRLESGIAPVKKMLQSGIDVAFGMDGLSVNDDNDIFQDMRLCSKLHCLQETMNKETNCLSPKKLFQMDLLSGAKATMFENEIGKLEVDKKADIVLMNYNKFTDPWILSGENIKDFLFYRGRGVFVDTVIVNGSIVMENRKFTRLSRDFIEENIYAALSKEPTLCTLRRRDIVEQMTPYIRNFIK